MNNIFKDKIYECGTLRYSLAGVITICALIMLGFFCMNFVGSAVSGLIPIHLKNLNASNTTIAFIMTTIGGIFNLTVCPAVSFKSDRYRGKRWGRRCVFIISTLPFFAGSVFLFAASKYISQFIANFANLAPATVTIGVIAIIMAMYQFFYMFVASVIYYIYNDCIPTVFLARVVGMSRVAAVAASAVFNYFFFQYAQSHFAQLMLMVGIVYTIGVSLMCFGIKEPQLPPLAPEETQKSQGLLGVLTFMKESFSHKFYIYCFLGTAFTAASLGIGTFLIFFLQDMKLDLAAVGKINGISGIAGMILGVVLATFGTIFVDKWHPVRMHVWGIALLLVIPIFNCRWLFLTPNAKDFFNFYLIENIFSLFLTSAVALAAMPALMLMLPKSRFGQFCSARAMFVSITNLILGFLLGIVIDLVKNFFSNPEYVYRLMWVWRVFWAVLGAILLIKMYSLYLKLGGSKNYQAPAVWEASGFEAIPQAPSLPQNSKLVKIGIYILDLFNILLVTIFASLLYYVYSNNLTIATKNLIIYALPILIISLIVYLFLRFNWWSDIKRLTSDSNFISIHHGVIYTSSLVLFSLLGIGVFLIFSSNSNLWGIYYAIQMVTCLVVTTIMGISSWIEKKNYLNKKKC